MAGAAIQAAKMFAPKGTAAKNASVVTEIGIGLTLGLIAGGGWKVCVFSLRAAATMVALPPTIGVRFFSLSLIHLSFCSRFLPPSPLSLSLSCSKSSTNSESSQSWHWSERRKIEEYYKSLNESKK